MSYTIGTRIKSVKYGKGTVERTTNFDMLVKWDTGKKLWHHKDSTNVKIIKPRIKPELSPEDEAICSASNHLTVVTREFRKDPSVENGIKLNAAILAYQKLHWNKVYPK